MPLEWTGYFDVTMANHGSGLAFPFRSKVEESAVPSFAGGHYSKRRIGSMQGSCRSFTPPKETIG